MAGVGMAPAADLGEERHGMAARGRHAEEIIALVGLLRAQQEAAGRGPVVDGEFPGAGELVDGIAGGRRGRALRLCDTGDGDDGHEG